MVTTKLSSDILTQLRNAQMHLTEAADIAHKLNVEHGVSIQWEFGIGPDGKFGLRKFQPMVPYDMTKDSQ